MMKFKKFLAAAMTGAMMFGSVAMAAPAINVYADDSSTTAPTFDKNLTVYVDYASLQAVIDSERGDSYILLDVLKVDNSGNVDTTKATATYSYPLSDGEYVLNWDEYDEDDESEGHDLIIDLSFLKLSKDCAIQIRGNADGFKLPSQYVMVNKQEKKQSFKFTPTTEKVGEKEVLSIGASFAIKNTAIGKENVGLYEFKTLYGSDWKNLGDFDIDTAIIAGTTLMIRKAAVTIPKSATDSSNLAPAGAEAKVKIAAAPKAPKVKVDYKKGTITLPKDSTVTVLYTTGGGTKDVTVPAYMTVTSTAMYKKETVDVTASYKQLTDDDLKDYFTVAADGTVTAKAGVTLYSDNNGTDTVINFTTDIATYVTGHEETTEQKTVAAGTEETAPIQVGSANVVKTPAEILDYWKEGTGKVDKDELLASGFSISVQTNAKGKKSASNKAFIGIAKEETPTPSVADKKVTLNGGTFSWTYDETKKTYTFKSGTLSFDYVIADKSATKPVEDAKWTTVADGKESKKKAADVEGKKIFVRVSGDAKATPAKLPSGYCGFEIEAAGNGDTTTKATVAVGTESEITAAGTILIEDANATSPVNVPLTITVTDADGTAVTDASKYSVKITKGTATATVTGVNWANNQLTFNAVNDTTAAGPTLVAGEKYVVTVTYGSGDDAVTESAELTVAAKETPNS